MWLAWTNTISTPGALAAVLNELNRRGIPRCEVQIYFSPRVHGEESPTWDVVYYDAKKQS